MSMLRSDMQWRTVRIRTAESVMAFQPGCSGNPGGRPRVLERELERLDRQAAIIDGLVKRRSVAAVLQGRPGIIDADGEIAAKRETLKRDLAHLRRVCSALRDGARNWRVWLCAGPRCTVFAAVAGRQTIVRWPGTS
jgi:hypothetical protein